MTEPSHPERNDELHWLAFRYVAGDLAANEEERFESQLAEDQGAREAVEQAVALHEAIRLAAMETVPTTRQPGRHGARLAWAASLAAAIVLSLLGLFQLVSTKAPLPPADEGRASEPGAEVARTWVEVRQAQRQEDLAAEPAPLTGPELEVGDLAEPDASVPKWMMTAFAKQPKQK